MTIHNTIQKNHNFRSLNTPIHKASTVIFDTMDDLRQARWIESDEISYGLQNTPTSLALIGKLCEIEGGQFGILTPSGLSAIHLVYMTCLKPKGHILIMNTVYDPNRHLGNWLRNFCPELTIEYFPPDIGENIIHLIRPNTCLIWLESPGSVTMEVSDIPIICHIAREHHIPTALDDTWSAGVFFKPFEYGVDFSIQALTKYQSGGSDILMGAVLTKNPVHYQEIKKQHTVMGLGVSSDDCYQILKGLESLEIRLETQGKRSQWIAGQLAQHPAIWKVLHPAFRDCPGHDHWKKYFTGTSSLFSILLNPNHDLKTADQVVNSLEHFKIGYSWGGSHSLALSTRPSAFRLPEMTVDQIFMKDPALIRLYIGLENPNILLQDLLNALDQI